MKFQNEAVIDRSGYNRQQSDSRFPPMLSHANDDVSISSFPPPNAQRGLKTMRDETASSKWRELALSQPPVSRKSASKLHCFSFHPGRDELL